MKALLLVDIQNDFVSGGALAVPHGDEVIEVANRLMPCYDFVVATQDWHPADHLSFATQHSEHIVGTVIELDGLQQILWPDHCVQDTRGGGLCEDLDQACINAVVRKGMDRRIDSYSGFFDNGDRRQTELAELLQAQGVDELHVMGLATDYCVKFTALDARRLGFETSLIVEGCRAVEINPGDSGAAIEEMIAAGIGIIERATRYGGRTLSKAPSR